MKLRIVIADDHPLVLAAVSAALGASEDMEVVATADTGDRALSVIARERPDIVMLDLHMPGPSGIECVGLIRERHPGVKIVMLSASRERRDVDRALEAGASAYVDKRVGTGDIAAILRQVHAGTVRVAAPAPTDDDDLLTSRERDVLQALSRGLSNKAISAELWVTEQTVKFHLGNIYRKLGVSSRSEAQRLVYETGRGG